LLYAADELAERLADEFLGDVRRGISLVDGLLEVEARSRRAELKRGYIFLDVRLKLVDALRCLACANDHHAGCQRVERASMTHFELPDAQSMAQTAADSGDKVETCPAERFVEAKYLSLDEVHQSTI